MAQKRHTYQASQDGDYSVYEWGIYERGSVLAGQPKKCFVGAFETPGEVLAEYPDAVPSHPMIEPQVCLDHLPDEDTPVAGGLYPDDWTD